MIGFRAVVLAASLAVARVAGAGDVPLAERLTTINPTVPDFFAAPPSVAAGQLYFYGGTADGNGLHVWDETLQRPRLLGELPDGGVVELRGRAYFVGFRGDVNSLWTTDGTFAGTQPVVRVEGAFNPVFVAGELLYFMGQTSVWRSDGTEAGTFPLNVKGAFTVESAEFAQLGGDVLFLSQDPDANRIGLWKSGGTIATTVLIADLGAISRPGERYARFTYGLTRVGQRVVFFTFEGLDYRMWSTDGTGAGTAPVRDFVGDGGGIGSYTTPLGPSKPVGDAAALFFADDGVHGRELWRTNGTATGTRLVKDIAPGPASSDSAGSFGRTFSISPPLSGFQLLAADDGIHGTELWRSDGTEAGTRLVADITPGPDSSTPYFFVRAGSNAVFAAEDGRIWRSDGTESGTARLGDLFGVPSPLGDGASIITRTGLWRTDGESLELLASGGIPEGLSPLTIVGAGGHAVFDGAGLEGLWASDGTSEGTHRVGDFELVNDMNDAAGRAWFVPYGGLAHGEPWVSDGTNEGTHPLVTGPPPDGARDFTQAGRRVFFTSNADHGSDLWVTGGDAASTRRVEEFPFIGPLTALGDSVYFAAYDALWRSDGTLAGTASVADLYEVIPSAATDRLYAFALDGIGFDLRVSDGTAAGTTLVRTGFHAPTYPTPSGTRLFFDSMSWTSGRIELWVSDGTASGTRLLHTFVTIDAIAATGDGSVFVAARDDEHGSELWHSDGTPEGTILLDDILPGPEGSAPSSLVVVDGVLLFAARDAEHGVELWRSDGTTGGTLLLQDLFPGPASSEPSSLTVVGPRVFFRATDPEAGPQLWEMPTAGLSGAPRPGERPRVPRLVPPR